jgi:diaminopimelate decarboxylase
VLGDAPHLTCYAVKANDALALLAVVAEEGLGADIVSGGELAKSLRAGIPAARIVFSGVGKRLDEIRTALEAGVRSLNVETLEELEDVSRLARELGITAPASVRLNPGVETATHAYLATGGAEDKFGVDAETARQALRQASSDPALAPVGLSFHVGSQLLDPAPILAAAEQAADLWRELAPEGIALHDLDVGGGIGIPYGAEGEADLAAFLEPLKRLAAELDAVLVLEPGRYLAGPVGTLVTGVLHVKAAGGRMIAVCDAGSNELLRPALYAAEHPLELLGAGDRPEVRVDVVGPLCESGDFLALDRALPHPRRGDLIAVGAAGAYGRVMSSTYNARPLCAEVVLEAGTWRVTRERGSYDDLIRNERA